jgi:hypothetical protein
MKNYLLIISMIILSSCNEAFQVQTNSLTPAAGDICSGKTILNVVGTADCSGSGAGSSSDPIMMLSFASRKDNGSFPVTAPEFTAFFAAPDRVVATLQDEAEENLIFTNNHSVIPNPFNDSDGRYQMTDYNGNPIAASTEKKHYLETIAKNGPITARANIVVCGSSGTIEARIAGCATLNGLWSFYDGKKYGQDGEGDWKLVSVVGAGPKFEVWRDERTKLLWSDKSSANYNWYQAAGYSKPDGVSEIESEFLSSPGTTDPQLSSIMQPASPISVCPDVDAGEIAAGGGTATYTYVNPEADFKAGLSHPETTWRLPSRNDWLLAEVNGIRKVLPNMDGFYFWSSSSVSSGRKYAWYFYGGNGSMSGGNRNVTRSVRCVASSRD